MKEEKHAIITIGDSHFVVRIINFHHNLNYKECADCFFIGL